MIDRHVKPNKVWCHQEVQGDEIFLYYDAAYTDVDKCLCLVGNNALYHACVVICDVWFWHHIQNVYAFCVNSVVLRKSAIR